MTKATLVERLRRKTFTAMTWNGRKIVLANPDGPEAANALEALETLVHDLIPFLGNIAQMLDEMKVEREQSGIGWTAYNQEQREALTGLLRRAKEALSLLDGEGGGRG